MTHDLSPEERLLRLIKHPQGQKPQEPQKAPQETQKPPQEIEKIVSEKEESKIKKVKNSTKELFSKGNGLDYFKISVMLLILVFIGGIFYFSYEFFGKKQQPVVVDVEKLIAPDTKVAKEKQETRPDKTTQVQEEDNQPEFRELFGAPATRETPSIKEGPSASDLAKDLALVGVITGDNPQAIIEDKKTRQTYYCFENESVLQFKVKKIEKATVILDYNGETFKMSL